MVAINEEFGLPQKAEMQLGSDGASEYVGDRLGAATHLIHNDLIQGIEGRDMIDDATKLPRNLVQAGYHLFQSFWPIAADAVSTEDQDYIVAIRKGPLHGTANSVRRVFDSKGVLRKVSAVAAEAPDGPVDDVWSAATGGSEWIIEPIATPRSSMKELMNTKEEDSLSLSA